MTSLLTQNTKIKRTSESYNIRLFNFGLPAYKSLTGKIICPMADECIEFCYARKGAYVWSNVKPAFERRYELSKTDKFVRHINADIVLKEPDFVRVHDSGDYYSKAYMNKWFDIAESNPDVKFYSYTNMVGMVKKADIPDNYDFIFSSSGKQKHLIDEKVDRHSKIFKSIDELNLHGYVDASNYDVLATKWFSDNNRIGLIMH